MYLRNFGVLYDIDVGKTSDFVIRQNVQDSCMFPQTLILVIFLILVHTLIQNQANIGSHKLMS